MAVGVGTGFDISGLLDSITKADKALSNLMNKSNQTSRSIVTAFQQMSSQGVMPYVQSLEKNLSVYNAIRDSITDTAGRARKGFGDMKADIDKVIVSTETLMTSLSRSPEFKFESQKKAAQEHRDFMVRMYTEMFDTIERREKQNKSAKQNSQSYAQNYQQQLSAYERLFDEAIAREDKKKKEQAERDAKREAEEHKRKMDNINKRFDLIERRNKRDAQRQTEYLNSPKGALEYAKGLDNGVKSINTMNQALQQLRNAQANVNINTEAGRKKHAELGNAIARVEKDLKKYSNSANDVNEKHKKLINTGDQLKRALTAIFSVSAIKGYINKIVDVRGEFELQHRSLQAIIQDVDKANKLWDKTIALAVKSPFRVKDLVTYTKQLAAYRVEADKLYDTTKMLADVSAGLGVDMNRLILAYGQVKAATYLRGTELRQFTEAGIPMLDELAKYFTELENRFVSAADVFDRISKRGVTFEDVDVVFKKITSEDGVFYKMQEKQADTLKGMINNLRDSIDIMMNDIGKSQEYSLKGIISSTKSIVDNWRYVGIAIKQVGFAAAIAALRKLVTGWKAVTLATFEGTAAMTGAAKAGATLRLGLQKLFKTMTNHPWAFVFAALAAGTHAWINHKRAVKEANEAYDDAARTEVKKINSLKAIHDQIEANNNAIKNNSDKEKENTEAIESNKDALAKLKAEYPDVFNGITQNIDGTVQLTSAIEEQNKILRANIALQHQAKGGSFYEGLKENYEDAIEARSALYAGIEDVKGAAEDINQKAIAAYDTGEISKEAYDNIMKYLDLLREAEDASDIMNVDVSLLSVKKGRKIDLATQDKLGITKFLRDRNAMYIKLDSYQNTHVKNFKESLDRQMSTYKNMMKTFETDAERGAWLKEQLENLGIFDKEMQEVAKEHIIAETGFAIKFPDPNQVRVQLKEWQEEYNRRFGDKEGTDEIDPHASFVKIRNIAVKQTDVISRLQDDYKETKDLIDRINAAGGEVATAAGGAYEGLNVGKLTAELNQIQEQIEWFGAPLEKKQKKSIEILNRRISLIKEMYEEYNKVHQESTATEAKEDVAAAYKDTFIEAFEGTGIDFSKPVINKEELDNLIEAGDDAGSAFSDAMLAKIKKIEDAGIYIRNFTDELIPFTEKWETFIPYAYYDQDEKVNGKPVKASESKTKKGTLTIGTGITNNSGIDYKFDENAVITEAENQELLSKIYETKAKNLNVILDKNKELLLTQEQYNMLLDQYYQGEAGASKAISLAQGDWGAFEKYLNTIKNYKQLNKKHVVVDVDAIKEEWDALDTLQEKLALVMKWTNITTKQTKVVDGKKVTERFISSVMQERSIARSQVFSGDLEVVKLLQKSAIDVSQIDFTNIEGVIEILKKLKPIAEKEGEEAELALSRAISEFEAELNIKPKIEERESIERSIDELFGNYEISLEMDKLNIPKDLASKLFGFDAIDLDDIRGQVLGQFGMGGMEGQSNEQIYSSEAFKNLSEERQEELRKSLEKEQQLQNKYLEDNLKKYMEYSRKALGERAKIKVDEINQLNEIEKTFKPVSTEGITDPQKLKEIEERNRLLKEQGDIAKKAVQEQSFQKMKKIEWDELRSSDEFNNMFNDLDKVSEMSINAAIKRIQEFKKEWKDMPVAAAKEMLRKLNELQLALYDSGNVRKDKKKIEQELNQEIEKRELSGRANTTIGQQNLSEAIRGENQAYTEIIEKSNKRIELLQLINSLEGTNKQEQLNKLGYTIEYLDALGLTTEMVVNTAEANDDLIKKEQDIVDEKNEQIASNQKILNLITKQKSKAEELGEVWSKTLGMAKDLYSSFQDIAEAANWDFADEMAIFGEMGVSMADAVINAIALSAQLAAVETGAIAAGTALNTALGVVGLIVMGVQLLVSGINAISDFGQNKRAKEIEKEAKYIKDLAEKYEKLKDAIDNAYSAAQLAVNSKSAQQNLEAQIDATKRQIATLENAKQLSDDEEDQLEGLKEDLIGLEDQLDELKDNVASIATGGIFDDVSSVADDFVDAWLTAFEETGDGMKGLEENFDEMLKTILKKQMSMQLVGDFAEKWKKSLSNYVNEDDTVLTPEEAGEWAKGVKDSFGQVNENLLNFANALESEGISLVGGQGELSGLSAGISGITEDQADILASYWNAVRFSAASIDSKMDLAINEFKKLSSSGNENPMYTELQIQSKIIREIRDSINSVIGDNATQAINIRT